MLKRSESWISVSHPAISYQEARGESTYRKSGLRLSTAALLFAAGSSITIDNGPCNLTTRWSGPRGMVGRVWPRHGHRGRPLNWVVRAQPNEHRESAGNDRRWSGSRRYGRRPVFLVVIRSGLVGSSGAHLRWGVGPGRGHFHNCGHRAPHLGLRCNEPMAISALVLPGHTQLRYPERQLWRVKTGRLLARVGSNHVVGVSCSYVIRAIRRVAPNNALERTVEQRGPRLAAASASWSAAQLGR